MTSERLPTIPCSAGTRTIRALLPLFNHTKRRTTPHKKAPKYDFRKTTDKWYFQYFLWCLILLPVLKLCTFIWWIGHRREIEKLNPFARIESDVIYLNPNSSNPSLNQHSSFTRQQLTAFAGLKSNLGMQRMQPKKQLREFLSLWADTPPPSARALSSNHWLNYLI